MDSIFIPDDFDPLVFNLWSFQKIKCGAGSFMGGKATLGYNYIVLGVDKGRVELAKNAIKGLGSFLVIFFDEQYIKFTIK